MHFIHKCVCAHVCERPRSPGRCAAVPLHSAACRCADSAGPFPARAPSAWFAHGRNGAICLGEEFYPSARVHLQPRGTNVTDNESREGEGKQGTNREIDRDEAGHTGSSCVCI